MDMFYVLIRVATTRIHKLIKAYISEHLKYVLFILHKKNILLQ